MTLIGQVRSRLELQVLCDKLYTTRGRRPLLKSMILLSDQSPEDLHRLLSLDKRVAKGYDIKVESLKDGLFLLRIKKEVWEKSVGGLVVVDTSLKGCWITYTDESGYFLERVLEPFFTALYPNVARVPFNYQQIQKFLGEIKDAYHGSSVVTAVSYKRQSLTGRGRGTRMLWERGAESELQKDLKQYRIWIDSISFHVTNEEGIVLLEASLSGNGIARLRFGTFSEFYHNVIQLYVGLATKWKSFFSDRERRIERGGVTLRPYLLEFPFEVEKPEIDDLIANLKGSYSHSIFFGGNPYFVANLSDYKDGSSFYLTVLAKTVTITPMLRSTPFALWRIASRVQRVAGEGEIRDVSRGLPT